MRLFRKPRFLWVYVLVTWLFVVAHTSERSMRLGLLLIVLGEALRCWANGYVGHRKVNWTQTWRHDPKIGQFVTAGPYAYARHPLYLGTFFIGAGFCVIVSSAWLSVAALGFFLTVYHRKAAQEEAILLHEWGEAFEHYREAVPRWWPTWRRFPEPNGQWSWQGMWASKELKAIVWIAVLLIVLYFREELVQERERLLQKHAPWRLVLLGLLAALMLGDGVIELIRRRSKRIVTVAGGGG